MTGAHVGHDAQIGDRVILVNQVAIAGHCVLGDDVIVGGLSGVHQWVRIGQGAIIGAVTMVTNDVLPYGLVQGPRGELDGLNLVGLKRRGVDRADIAALRAAYQELAQGEGTFLDRARRLSEENRKPARAPDHRLHPERQRPLVPDPEMTAAGRIAVIAGRGTLPGHVAAALDTPLIVSPDGFLPDGLVPDLTFRLERLVPLLDHLTREGVTRVIFAGAVQRPRLDPALFDPATAQLVPQLLAALQSGDDAALRVVMAIFEEAGFQVVGAAEVAPDARPRSGALVRRDHRGRPA